VSLLEFWSIDVTTKHTELSIRPGTPADAQHIAACVKEAYEHYVERIGQPPGPMLEDYDQVIRDRQVCVAELDREIVGVLVLRETAEGFLLDNVAVSPRHQRAGIGTLLLELAESRARAAGFASIYLYTHEKMTENQIRYARIGYVEYDRRTEQGLTRVFMRKQLA
jgi:GNAT superfamily N-acetyltransferase